MTNAKKKKKTKKPQKQKTEKLKHFHTTGEQKTESVYS